MPNSSIPWGGIIAGGTSIVGSAIDAIAQNSANKKSQRYATYMYDRQRADALADWQMQNEYNSPASIMARYKAAGLNPNLIYQQSPQSPSVRSSSPQAWRAQPITSGVGQAGQSILQGALIQQQIDTMKTAQSVNAAREKQIMADTILKGYQSGLVGIKTAASAFELGYQKSIVGVRSDTMSANLDKIKAQKDQIVTSTFMSMHEDMRRQVLAQATLEQKMQNVALMLAQEQAVKEGVKLTKEKVLNMMGQTDILGNKEQLMDLEKRLRKSTLDYQDIERLRQWIAPLILKF